LPEVAWRSIGRADLEDADYAESIYELPLPAGESRLVKSFQYPRSRKVAIHALKRAKYTCEVEPTIRLFIARSTGTPYLEPHHLIPMSLQGSFKSISLDHTDNVYALSPHHHRRIHFGLPADSQEVVETLLCRRSSLLKKYGVSQDDILGFYNCLKID
jgi:5-methylcytosine-specific restriction protein A